MKRLNLWIIGLEEGEKPQLKKPETIINKILVENFPNLKKVMPIMVKYAYRTSNRFNQIRKSVHHIIFKAVNV